LSVVDRLRWIRVPRDYKRSPRKTDFHYGHLPFKTSFSVLDYKQNGRLRDIRYASVVDRLRWIRDPRDYKRSPRKTGFHYGHLPSKTSFNVLDYKQNRRLRDMHDAFVQYFPKLFLSNDDLRSIGDGLKNADEEGGNLKYSKNNRKPDPTTTLFTTNPTCNDVR
jgi:hypothetical protein